MLQVESDSRFPGLTLSISQRNGFQMGKTVKNMPCRVAISITNIVVNGGIIRQLRGDTGACMTSGVAGNKSKQCPAR
jgi:hypothetical protein